MKKRSKEEFNRKLKENKDKIKVAQENMPTLIERFDKEIQTKQKMLEDKKRTGSIKVKSKSCRAKTPDPIDDDDDDGVLYDDNC